MPYVIKTDGGFYLKKRGVYYSPIIELDRAKIFARKSDAAQVKNRLIKSTIYKEHYFLQEVKLTEVP